MEAPRLRLIVLAWLRGLLTPDYPMGVQSIVRENIILSALDKEYNGREFMALAQLQAAMLPLLNAMGAKQGQERSIALVKTGSALLQNQDSATIRRNMRALTMSSPEEAAAAFELLKTTPIFDNLRETLNAAKDEGLLEGK